MPKVLSLNSIEFTSIPKKKNLYVPVCGGACRPEPELKTLCHNAGAPTKKNSQPLNSDHEKFFCPAGSGWKRKRENFNKFHKKNRIPQRFLWLDFIIAACYNSVKCRI